MGGAEGQTDLVGDVGAEVDERAVGGAEGQTDLVGDVDAEVDGEGGGWGGGPD